MTTELRETVLRPSAWWFVLAAVGAFLVAYIVLFQLGVVSVVLLPKVKTYKLNEGGPVLFLVVMAALSVTALAYACARVRVGRNGVEFETWMGKVFWPWSEIDAIEARDLEVTLKRGKITRGISWVFGSPQRVAKYLVAMQRDARR